MRVFVVEDEIAIALMLEDMLAELGHEPAGLAMRLDDALDQAKTLTFDLAILDVNLDGHPSFAVADILRERGLPFVFATGYGPGGLAPAYADCPILPKPFMLHDLERALAAVAPGG